MQISLYLIDPARVLAPITGVTDKPFHLLCKHLGAGPAASKMTRADPNLWQKRKSLKRMNHAGEPDPVSVQSAGYHPAMLADTVRYHVVNGVQIIDINMGCPAKKVCNVWSGSVRRQDEPLVARIAHRSGTQARSVSASLPGPSACCALQLTLARFNSPSARCWPPHDCGHAIWRHTTPGRRRASSWTGRDTGDLRTTPRRC